MLLTRLPLGIATPFDLHVLGTPPALVLSQDQTLHKKSMEPSIQALISCNCTKSRDSKTLPIKAPSCEVGDPQTYTLAALFSFQGTNVNPKATQKRIDRPRWAPTA